MRPGGEDINGGPLWRKATTPRLSTPLFTFSISLFVCVVFWVISAGLSSHSLNIFVTISNLNLIGSTDFFIF